MSSPVVLRDYRDADAVHVNGVAADAFQGLRQTASDNRPDLARGIQAVRAQSRQLDTKLRSVTHRAAILHCLARQQ